MLTAVRRIFGRIAHSQIALRSQWDKRWKNNLPFTSPSIRRPTAREEAAKRAAVKRAKEERKQIRKEKIRQRINGMLKKSIRKTGQKGRDKNGRTD